MAVIIAATWLVSAAGGERTLIPVTFLESVTVPAKGKLPAFRRLSNDDPRAAKGYSLLENEAAMLIRELLYALPRALPSPEPLSELYVALERGGNNARQGFSLIDGGKELVQQRVPYLLLEVTPERMSHTLLHEGGHVLHRIARRFRPDVDGQWTPLPHTTFAVTDRATALSEGGEPFPLEFDLNASSRAEVEAVTSLTETQRARILAEIAQAPFRSFKDFQQRTGLAGSVIGLELIKTVQ